MSDAGTGNGTNNSDTKDMPADILAPIENNLENEVAGPSITPQPSIEPAPICSNEILPKKNDFVMVNFPTNKRTRTFIGQVILDKKKLKISYLRKKKGMKSNYFCFPVIPDIQDLNQGNVEKVVRGINLNRNRIIFPDIDLKNVECDFFFI